MKKGINPVSVVAAMCSVLVSIILAFVIKGCLPDSAKQWGGMIFWLVIIAVGGAGTFLSGKKLNGKRK